jgi:hypothetical protein
MSAEVLRAIVQIVSTAQMVLPRAVRSKTMAADAAEIFAKELDGIATLATSGAAERPETFYAIRKKIPPVIEMLTKNFDTLTPAEKKIAFCGIRAFTK